MDNYDNEILKLEILSETPCDLNHNGISDKESCRAIDTIKQDIGYPGQPMYNINIFVCQGCVNRLHSQSFILLYCLKCTHNKWIVKPYAKMDYGSKHICWMSCCPECAENGEKAEVFFTD